MARRSEDWDVGLAKGLRDPAFAREFLLAAIDEGVDLQLALGKVIRNPTRRFWERRDRTPPKQTQDPPRRPPRGVIEAS
jgi:hypothetical protein